MNNLIKLNNILRCSGHYHHQNHYVHLRFLSTIPAERKADFFPRVLNKDTFPDVETLKLKRGTGYRSSFNGLIVTVFGATGFIAKSVVNNLAKCGSQVICPYRGDSFFTKNLKLAGDLGQILFVPYSLNDVDTLYRAMKYSNVVINLIGRGNETNNFDFETIHVEGPRTIARIARELGIKRLIHVSSLNSSPNPPAYYLKGGSKFLKSKYWGEIAVREEYPDVTIFRPADVYGECDNFLWYYCFPHRRGFRTFPLPSGGYGITKTPVSVSDLAEGIVNSITDDAAIGQTFDAVGPRRYELRRLALYINDIIGKQHDCGFRVTNLRWDLQVRPRLFLWSNLKSVFKKPKTCWERIEREAISDEVSKNLQLTDLGVRLQHIEDHWPFLLAAWKWNGAYDGDLGENRVYEHPVYTLDSGLAKPSLI